MCNVAREPNSCMYMYVCMYVRTCNTRSQANSYCIYSTEGLHIASTEACIFATGYVDIKPCRFEDLYSYKEDCVEDQGHRMAACDTVRASKLASKKIYAPILPSFFFFCY